MSDAELEAKFRDNAALGGFAGDIEALLAALRGFDALESVARPMRLAGG